MPDILSNPTMGWLPPVVLVAIIMIGALIGFWNGWKTALYFTVWNVLAIVTAVLTYDAIFDLISDKLPSSQDVSDIDIKALVKANETTAKPIIGTIVALSEILVFNIIAFIIYWVFFPLRRLLKRNIKENRKNGISNNGTRILGASLGVITALPAASFATSLSTAASEENSFTDAQSKLTKGLSFGQLTNVNENIHELVAIADIATNTDLQDTVKAIFGTSGETIDPSQLSKTDLDTIKTALNSPLIINSIPVIKDQIQDISSIDWSDPSSVGNQFSSPLVSSVDQQNKLVDAIISNGMDNGADKSTILSFLQGIGVFSTIS